MNNRKRKAIEFGIDSELLAVPPIDDHAILFGMARKEKVDSMVHWHTRVNVNGQETHVDLTSEEKARIEDKVHEPGYNAIVKAGLFKQPEAASEDRNFFHILGRSFK